MSQVKARPRIDWRALERLRYAPLAGGRAAAEEAPLAATVKAALGGYARETSPETTARFRRLLQKAFQQVGRRLEGPNGVAAVERALAALPAPEQKASPAAEALDRLLEQEDWYLLPDVAASLFDILKTAYEEGSLGAIASLQQAGAAAGYAATFVAPEDTFTLVNPDVVRLLEAKGAALVRHVDEGTRFFLRQNLLTGVENGWSAREIADHIQANLFGLPPAEAAQLSESRILSIVQTELNWADSRATHDQFAAVGLRSKRWITSGHDQCDVCLRNEAAGFVPLAHRYEDVFGTGTPHPPAHPRTCRCYLASAPEELKAFFDAGAPYWTGGTAAFDDEALRRGLADETARIVAENRVAAGLPPEEQKALPMASWGQPDDYNLGKRSRFADVSDAQHWLAQFSLVPVISDSDLDVRGGNWAQAGVIWGRDGDPYVEAALVDADELPLDDIAAGRAHIFGAKGLRGGRIVAEKHQPGRHDQNKHAGKQLLQIGEEVGRFKHPDSKETPLYEIRNAKGMLDRQGKIDAGWSILVDLKERRVFGFQQIGDELLEHEVALSAITKPGVNKDIDSYVRLFSLPKWGGATSSGELSAIIFAAGAAAYDINGKIDPEKAINRIYRAFDLLHGLGLPEETKTAIMGGEKIISGTLKSLGIEKAALDSAMVALEVPEEIAALLGVEEEPHVTVAYLGKLAAGFDLGAAVRAVLEAAEASRPFTARLNGQLEALGPPGEQVRAALVQVVPELLALRAALRAALLRHGQAADATWADYKPHVTVGVTGAGDTLPEAAQSWWVDRLWLYVGGSRVGFPLGGAGALKSGNALFDELAGQVPGPYRKELADYVRARLGLEPTEVAPEELRRVYEDFLATLLVGGFDYWSAWYKKPLLRSVAAAEVAASPKPLAERAAEMRRRGELWLPLLRDPGAVGKSAAPQEDTEVKPEELRAILETFREGQAAFAREVGAALREVAKSQAAPPGAPVAPAGGVNIHLPSHLELKSVEGAMKLQADEESLGRAIGRAIADSPPPALRVESTVSLDAAAVGEAVGGAVGRALAEAPPPVFNVPAPLPAPVIVKAEVAPVAPPVVEVPPVDTEALGREVGREVGAALREVLSEQTQKSTAAQGAVADALEDLSEATRALGRKREARLVKDKEGRVLGIKEE